MSPSAFLCLIVLLASTSTLASETQEQRHRVFARLPDWTGIWIADDGIMTRLGLRNDVEGEVGPTFKDRILAGHPPYSAEWETKYQAALEDRTYFLQAKECGFYFPGVMESPWVFEVLITPEQTTFIFAGREIRHIYTDGRDHMPREERWSLAWGDSIGHWEGDTLIVDTISVQPQSGISLHGPMLGASAHFTERIRKVDRDHLVNVMSIVDPASLTRPWTLSLPYARSSSIDRLIHGDCMQNDRNPVVDGKLTVTGP